MKITRVSFPLADPKSTCHRIVFSVPTDEIAYTVMIVESWGHIAIPRTIDQTRGIMELLTAPDFIEEAREMVAALAEEINLTPIHL